jgi:hypothetical protein
MREALLYLVSGFAVVAGGFGIGFAVVRWRRNRA